MTATTLPRVSVVLPVRNGMPFLAESLESILGQSAPDFELIVVDDGSTDGTPECLISYADPRIKVLRTEGRGLVAALNLGIKQGRGTFIARMDADDIAAVDRFACQLRRFEENPRVGVVFTGAELIDAHGRRMGWNREPIVSQEHVREGLTVQRVMEPLLHPSVMVRRSVVEAAGGYRPYECAEDMDLWLRLVDSTAFDKITAPLLKYRILDTSVSRVRAQTQAVNTCLAIASYELRRKTGLEVFDLYPRLRDEMQRLLDAAHASDHKIDLLSVLKTFIREGRFAAAARHGLANARSLPALRRSARIRGVRQLVDGVVAISLAYHESFARHSQD